MSADKRYYEERANELQNDLKKWAEKAAVKLITLSDELKQENIEIGQKLAEITARIKAINEAPIPTTTEEEKTAIDQSVNVAATLAPSALKKQLKK
jgi:urease accessory protein UreF